MIIVLLLFLVAVVYFIYYRRMRKPLYDLCKTLPDVGSLPVLGHTHWFVGDPERIMNNIEKLAELFLASGTKIAKIWIGPSLYIVPMTPEDAKKILENCLQKDSTYRYIRAWLGNGLFVSQAEIWKVHRRFLVPIFHNRNVERFIEVFGQHADVLAARLENKCGDPAFDVYPYITSCMIDIVFETALGESMDAQHEPDSAYLRARKVVLSIINMRIFKAWMRPDAIFNLTPYYKKQKDAIDFMRIFTNRVVKEKKDQYVKYGKSGEDRKDLLQLLLERDTDFTNVQLREHIDSLTIAGNDTTALVISYALLLLGYHQEEQDKLYRELVSIFGNSTRLPTKEDLNKMEYMERVLKEAMRLYNVVPIIGRKTETDLQLSTCTLPAGVACAIVPLVMHKSKELWGTDVDSFNPDRFLPENSVNRHPCAFLGFSYGARNCIGRNFGMLVMKSILATVLRKFKIRSRECDRFKIEILLFPIGGHLITVEKRY